MALFCNCRRVIGRAEPGRVEFGEWRVVKSRRWDCPSCGLDRKRRLAEMCGAAGVTRMITLTFDQPEVPGDLMSRGLDDRGHVARRPARHRFCDWDTHGYWYVPRDRKDSGSRNPGREGWRWRILPACPHCCRWVSSRLTLWRKRIRRTWPSFSYLHAREVHQSGAMHLHVAVTGIPTAVTRSSKSGKWMKAQWAEVGGGWTDLGKHNSNAGTDAGWYVGKYLAKQHGEGETFARGFRRWSRTADFAPHLRMVPKPDPTRDGGWSDEAAPLVLRGWLDPDGVERPARWWPVQSAAGARLDPRTANCPQRLAVVLREAMQEAPVEAAGRPDRWSVRSGTSYGLGGIWDRAVKGTQQEELPF